MSDRFGRDIGWGRPRPAVLGLAVLGAVLLAVVAASSWPFYGDEHAYWRAATRLLDGLPLYDAAAPPNTPYAYWYPPVLAQVLAPFTLIASPEAFTVFWTVLLMGCIWLLAGRDVFVALACIAFLPVALELRVRNAHLIIALLTVLALRRSWVFWIPAAALKLAPGLAVVYLLAAGRRREAMLVVMGGAMVLGLSVVLAPGPWRDFVAVALGRAASEDGTFVAIPYLARLAGGAGIAIVAGRRGDRVGEVGLVIAITLANPTLWGNAFSILLAIVPLLRSVPAAGREPASVT